MHCLIDWSVPGSNQIGQTDATEHLLGWHTILLTFQCTMYLSSIALQHSVTTESEKKTPLTSGNEKGGKKEIDKKDGFINTCLPTKTNFPLERFFSKHPLGFCSPHRSLASLTSSFCQEHMKGHHLARPSAHLNLSENKTFETNVVPLLSRIQNRIATAGKVGGWWD